MKSNPSVTIAKNASANLVRLLGSGVVALLLPAFLVRRLSAETYSAWALLLQWTAFIGVLDFGVQTAVARFIAHANELQDADQRDGIASTAFALLTAAAAVGLVLVVIVAWQLPHIFPSMPAYLCAEARIALLFMGGSFALGLPVSVIHAIFIGLQRNELPMVLVLLNRASLAGLVVLAVVRHWGLPAMGAAVAFSNFVSYLLALIAWRKLAPQIRIGITFTARTYFKQISSYCVATAVWLVAMLMISGLDLTIVGIFDYSRTAYYAVAATLTNFVAQAQGAIFSAFLPASAVLAAHGDGQRLGSMLVSSTRYGMLVLLTMALPLMMAGNWVLATWVGRDYAAESIVIFRVLLVANVIRLCALPYATFLLGTGQQRKVILSPLAEGLANVVASIVGAYLFGAIGVALGTLIGSFVSIGFHLFYNMPRTSLIVIDRAFLLRQGLLRPLLCATPVGLILVLQLIGPKGPPAILMLPIAIAGTGFLFWNYGLLGSDRQKLAEVIRF